MRINQEPTENSLTYNKSIIEYAGAGIFFCLLIFNCSNIIRNVLQQILMLSHVSPQINFWITRVTLLIIILLITNLFVSKLTIYKSKKLLKSTLVWALIILLLFQLYNMFNYRMFSGNVDFFKQVALFNRTILDSTFYSVMLIVYEICIYALVAVVIYRNIKKLELS